MKKMAHSLCLALLGFSLVLTPASADNDQPIGVEQLPQPAQLLLKSHFGAFKIVLAELDNSLLDKSYEVKFANGGSIEFDKRGNWTEIDCKGTAVPGALVPPPIARYVQETWKDATIVKIEKDRKHYEIELSNQLEVTFDEQFRVIDVDD